jgi:hypothetical protein
LLAAFEGSVVSEGAAVTVNEVSNSLPEASLTTTRYSPGAKPGTLNST